MVDCAVGAAARRHFIVMQNEQGGWTVRETHSSIERVFPTQREAIHFALFEAGTRHAAVSLTPNT
jgi:streptogramin lyase